MDFKLAKKSGKLVSCSVPGRDAETRIRNAAELAVMAIIRPEVDTVLIYGHVVEYTTGGRNETV